MITGGAYRADTLSDYFEVLGVNNVLIVHMQLSEIQKFNKSAHLSRIPQDLYQRNTVTTTTQLQPQHIKTY